MSVQMIQERLLTYQCASTLEEDQALREITQEIILAALGRTTFFDHAGFQGGTCLRIFHSLNRFSEDLDFALIEKNDAFKLSPYLDQIRQELIAYGYDLEIDDRSKKSGAVQKAFLKDDSMGKFIHLNYRPQTGPLRKLRIKLEVDTNPPLGATYEIPILEYPFPSAVKIFDLPSLFAGKIHALLCRKFIKGRDWYDFLWYTTRSTPINHTLLSAALQQHGPWKNKQVKTNSLWCQGKLSQRIRSLDWQQASQDVQPFIKAHDLPSLELWTTEFFLQQCEKIKDDV